MIFWGSAQKCSGSTLSLCLTVNPSSACEDHAVSGMEFRPYGYRAGAWPIEYMSSPNSMFYIGLTPVGAQRLPNGVWGGNSMQGLKLRVSTCWLFISHPKITDIQCLTILQIFMFCWTPFCHQDLDRTSWGWDCFFVCHVNFIFLKINTTISRHVKEYWYFMFLLWINT